MEKHGDITGNTPAEITPVKGTPNGRFYGSPSGGCAKPGCCQTKVGSGGSADHASTRAADAVKQATRK
jgi:hypothetical protein